MISDSAKLEYIFKVILGSFSKRKKKAIGIFTDNTLILFNKFVDDLNLLIDNYLNKMREIDLTRGGLLDFGDFFEILQNHNLKRMQYQLDVLQFLSTHCDLYLFLQ